MDRLPTRIWIAGEKITIDYQPDSYFTAEDDRMGFVDYSQNRIIIRENIPPTKKLKFLIHELMHWLASDSSVSSLLEGDTEDVVIDSFASGLTQLVQQLLEPVEEES